MSKRLLVMALIALTVCFVSAAYAEVQNVKVGGDLTVEAVSRNNVNLLKDSATNPGGLSADGIISIARVKFDANLTDNVDVTVRLLNERIWSSSIETTANGNGTGVDLDLAYVSLKDFLKDVIGVPLTLKIGRQEVKIGSGLLIADPDTNAVSKGNFAGTAFGDLSARKSIDAALAVLDFNPLTVTALASKTTEGTLLSSYDDVNMYALDGVYKTGVMDTMLEGTYVLETRNKKNPIGAAAGLSDINVFDGRVTSMPISNLSLSAEYAYMTQRDATIRADRKTASDYVVLLGANYTFANVGMTPWIGIDYSHLSRYWNPLGEDMSCASIMNLLFQNTDVNCVGLSAGAKPTQDISAKVRWATISLVEPVGTLLPAAGITGVNYTMDGGKKQKALGNEVDLDLAYDYTSDVQFGLNLGYYKPGNAFVKADRGAASQVIGSMKVSF
jgi:hypothetical protein